MARPQQLGRFGEDAAAEWYVASGYQLLDRNWRCRRGEIDLICARGDEVVFSEVKTRSSARYGSGFEAVNWKKQQTIRAVAAEWLQHSSRHYSDLRFDVVDVDANGHLRVAEGCF